MTDQDDICGATCGDGSPCQHPADSCPVPSHSDPEVDNPHGRPSKFDECRDEVLEAAKKPISTKDVAHSGGISKPTLYEWLDRYDSFSNEFKRARSEAAQTLIDRSLKGDWNASVAKHLLASTFDYVKTERREHAGDDGGPIMVIEPDDDD